MIHNHRNNTIQVLVKVLKVLLNNREITLCTEPIVRCPTELFELSIGISLECPVTLIYVTDVIE